MWSMDSEQCQSNPKLTESLFFRWSFTIHAGDIKLKLQTATRADDRRTQKQPTQLNILAAWGKGLGDRSIPTPASFFFLSSNECIWSSLVQVDRKLTNSLTSDNHHFLKNNDISLTPTNTDSPRMGSIKVSS